MRGLKDEPFKTKGMYRINVASMGIVFIGLAISGFTVLAMGIEEYLYIICCQRVGEWTPRFSFLHVGLLVAFVGIIIAGLGTLLQYHAYSTLRREMATELKLRTTSQTFHE